MIYLIGGYILGAVWAFFIGYHHCFEYKQASKSYVLKAGYSPDSALAQGIIHGIFSWLVIIAFRLFKDE
ncbi:MAG: hypothetical protein MJ210_02950 [Alphaproteobacteria bacterium]|nr:hypothetical protein [Alphaproteobacteria bacterium]